MNIRILGIMKAFASHIGVEGEACDYALDSNTYEIQYSDWLDCVIVEYAHHSNAHSFTSKWDYLPSNNELILSAWSVWGEEVEFIHHLFYHNDYPAYRPAWVR